ncbi:hypothetical protein PUN28_011045 [Cardiocondyla obscurior]|uniref:Ribosomal protein L14 n=1 Tax=Cardiocondyla obscurior TaxID=286306 RepID=A0AAW2FNC6_9HYME
MNRRSPAHHRHLSSGVPAVRVLCVKAINIEIRAPRISEICQLRGFVAEQKIKKIKVAGIICENVTRRVHLSRHSPLIRTIPLDAARGVMRENSV